MLMCECPKFSSCSAPIYPLDRGWRLRKHLHGEKGCFYLMEFAKPAEKAILRNVLAGELYQTLARVYPEVMSRPNPLQNQLKRSENNPPRIGKQPGRATG
jgi:hypothetical protein